MAGEELTNRDHLTGNAGEAGSFKVGDLASRAGMESGEINQENRKGSDGVGAKEGQTGEAVKSLGGNQAVSPDLRAALEAVNKASEKSDMLVETDIARILDENGADAPKTTDPKSADSAMVLLMQLAKKNMENNKN